MLGDVRNACGPLQTFFISWLKQIISSVLSVIVMYILITYFTTAKNVYLFFRKEKNTCMMNLLR